MKKYIVIEQAEGYDYLYGIRFFDNIFDAANHFSEAVSMFNLNSIFGEINIIKEWKK